MTIASAPAPTAGQPLRAWRQRRRLTQLELANNAQISTRHLSFVENGRSHPTREMILRLSDQLDIPLRQRNEVLHAAGFAPSYPEHRSETPRRTCSIRR